MFFHFFFAAFHSTLILALNLIKAIRKFNQVTYLGMRLSLMRLSVGFGNDFPAFLAFKVVSGALNLMQAELARRDFLLARGATSELFFRVFSWFYHFKN